MRPTRWLGRLLCVTYLRLPFCMALIGTCVSWLSGCMVVCQMEFNDSYVHPRREDAVAPRRPSVVGVAVRDSDRHSSVTPAPIHRSQPQSKRCSTVLLSTEEFEGDSYAKSPYIIPLGSPAFISECLSFPSEVPVGALFYL